MSQRERPEPAVPPPVQRLIDQLLPIVDPAYSANGIVAQVRADDERLAVSIADTADPHLTVHSWEIALESRPELCALDAVNDPHETPAVKDGHTTPSRTQV